MHVPKMPKLFSKVEFKMEIFPGSLRKITDPELWIGFRKVLLTKLLFSMLAIPKTLEIYKAKPFSTAEFPENILETKFNVLLSFMIINQISN